jgi:hypothetical protein
MPYRSLAQARAAGRAAASAFWVFAILFFVLATVVAVGTWLASPQSVLHDVASVVRMPIPGRGEANLAARGYGLYFGMLNAPMHRVMRAPRLAITLVPPDGMSDPDFAEVPHEIDVYVDGFHTVQVARIQVRAPGRYHVRVESPDESGGSFSIGELPTVLDAPQAVRRVAIPVLVLVGLSVTMTVTALLLRRRAERQVVPPPAEIAQDGWGDFHDS